MSYMIEFPPGPLPPNINYPPYVLFGIKGTPCFRSLPPNLPLNLVLHFAPKLQTWLLPQPTNLPQSSLNINLQTPHVGIDILDPTVTIPGLTLICTRMLQLSGAAPLPNTQFLLPSHSLPTSIGIHRTWTALGLPSAGLDGLRTHILMLLMHGDPVPLLAMQLIWDTFPRTHDIVREMGLNYLRSHLVRSYTRDELLAIQYWILDMGERVELLAGLGEMFYPEFKAQFWMEVWAVEPEKRGVGVGRRMGGDQDSGLIQRAGGESGGTRTLRVVERIARERGNRGGAKRKIRRLRSDSSLRSVETMVWDPPTQEPTARLADAWSGDSKH